MAKIISDFSCRVGLEISRPPLPVTVASPQSDCHVKSVLDLSIRHVIGTRTNGQMDRQDAAAVASWFKRYIMIISTV